MISCCVCTAAENRTSLRSVPDSTATCNRTEDLSCLVGNYWLFDVRPSWSKWHILENIYTSMLCHVWLMKLDTLPDRSAGMLTVGRSVRGCRGRSVCACMKQEDDFISLWDCGRLINPREKCHHKKSTNDASFSFSTEIYSDVLEL